MVLKKFFKTNFLLLLLFIMPFNALAYSDYIIPGGENIGIELRAKGIMIVGTYKVNGISPSTDAGLKIGDTITEIDNEPVYSIADLVKKINAKDEVLITYERNKKAYETKLNIYKEENIYKTGLYVKDSITGIGTLTYIDPNSKIFGALGHEIIEKSTGKILEIKDGKIFDSTVTSIDKSSNGTPGEKNAKYYQNDIQGDVKENTQHGIFGNYTDNLPNKQTYKVAKPNEIKTGEAIIRTVLNERTIKEYKINIQKLSKTGTTKNITFEIIDQELLETTGGIVQGMSGSPILQGNYIIGAVTHVVVDNPIKGYGIFITNMLEEGEN